MMFLWHLESQLLVIHGEIRSKTEQELKRRNWWKDGNLPKNRATLSKDCGTLQGRGIHWYVLEISWHDEQRNMPPWLNKVAATYELIGWHMNKCFAFGWCE